MIDFLLRLESGSPLAEPQQRQQQCQQHGRGRQRRVAEDDDDVGSSGSLFLKKKIANRSFLQINKTS